MLFNSIPFLVLFIILYTVYWNVSQPRKKLLLLASSILFYAWFSHYFLLHFLLVIIANYFASNYLFRLKSKNANTSLALKLVIAGNFINLAVFKYFYFFSDIAIYVTGSEWLSSFSSGIHIILPLAISFYTFQIVAIQVDIHRNIITDKIPFYDYVLFIIFFPQLIAGPIMRSNHFLPQINNPYIDYNNMIKGIYFILGGLFKKVVIADNISGIVVPVFRDPSSYDAGVLLLVLFGFAGQVYSDFSGYTDIARGTAFLLGYNIPENFRGPFLSTSFRDLWARWHVTLSTWLRDYLYIPLGGNKRGFFYSNLNMFITMCLGGLWHGASLNFLLWGAFLGALLWLERILELFVKMDESKLVTKLVKIPVVFLLFSLSGVFFGTASFGKHSWEKALQYFNGLLGNNSSGANSFLRFDELVLYIIIVFVFNFIQHKEQEYKIRKLDKVFIPAFSLVLLFLLGIYGDGGANFVYFQF